ncbi:hypothetical protein HOD75_03430 [archaeon]|jgi:hypothetical protein|nr:hypothetical protein [archaeon]MBT4241925.1 hypothetical protein [archaeon]MBT4418472.1 hypothetical protein [archaeon]
MVNKAVGYIISAIGLIAIALSIEDIAKIVQITLPFPANYLLYPGIALVVGGIVITITKGSSRQAKEVPIYKGKKIVGYREVK